MIEELTSGITVHEALQRFPAVAQLFNELGIDTCCGRGLTLAEAALRDGLDLDELLARAEAAILAGTDTASAGAA